MNSKRNEYLDLVKGVAIILVVIGHCIQFGSGTDYLNHGDFYRNPVFKFIYSFHMPLFMLISGYLFYFSSKKSTIQIIKSKIKGIIIPLIAWHTLIQLIMIASGKSISTTVFFVSYCHTLWFLRALFFCSILTLAINRILRDKLAAYIATTASLFFIPQRVLPDVFVFTTPFFFAGYLANKYQVVSSFLQLSSKNKRMIGACSSIVFIIMLWFYGKDYYVYVSKTYLFNKDHSIGYMLFVNTYRISTAIVGCIFILGAIAKTQNHLKESITKGLLINLSKSSLIIYIVNHYLNETILISLPLHQVNYVYVILETTIVILIGYGFYWLLKQHQLSKQLFLGGR